MSPHETIALLELNAELLEVLRSLVNAAAEYEDGAGPLCNSNNTELLKAIDKAWTAIAKAERR